MLQNTEANDARTHKDHLFATHVTTNEDKKSEAVSEMRGSRRWRSEILCHRLYWKQNVI